MLDILAMKEEGFVSRQIGEHLDYQGSEWTIVVSREKSAEQS